VFRFHCKCRTLYKNICRHFPKKQAS
jgi:hypothetical protein